MVEYRNRLLRRLGDDGREPGQDRDIGVAPAILPGPGFDIGIVGLRALDRRLAGEDDIGIARAELTRTIRRTGMQDHRMALGRAPDVERSGDVEIASLVVQRRGRIAVPKSPHHSDEFIRPIVAPLGVPMGLAREIAGGDFIRAGHQIPRRPALAQVIQRRQHARKIIGIVIGRIGGDDDTDMAGRGGQARPGHERFEA